MSNFMQESKDMESDLIAMRRHLHQNAEVGDDLPKTAAYVAEKLRAIGLEPQEISKCGLTATIKGGKAGKTIMLRADMDALPMEELNDFPFKSTTGFAHTCGHDMHSAMLLGAAKMLFNHRDELRGNVKLMFQPAEETFNGAASMIKNGIMDNPKVDAAMAMHVMTEFPAGTLGYAKGFVTSSCDGFKITIRGKGCHGAQPHNGIDPINVAAHMHLALQALIARETPPQQIAILTICQLVAGTTHNIMPETATMKGTMRTFDSALRTKLYKRFKEVVEYTAKSFGAAAELEVISDIPSIISNPDMIEQCAGYIKKLDYGFKFVPDHRATASDDYAMVSELVPSIFLNVGAAPEDPAKKFPNHNPRVEFNENCLVLGAAVFAQCAFEWLKDNA